MNYCPNCGAKLTERYEYRKIDARNKTAVFDSATGERIPIAPKIFYERIFIQMCPNYEYYGLTSEYDADNGCYRHEHHTLISETEYKRGKHG